MLKLKYKEIGIYLLLLTTLYFVFFQHLNSFHILNWDESMFAVNACEMIRNHNFIGLFYKNLPDLFNSKPPMQIWVQVLFIKLIGFNELAIRLPSALASSFSALLLFYFIRKRTTSLIYALCVFFVFITSLGVATFHTGRTGDADALLSFFILCYCISFYKWLFENKNISLFYFFLFLTLAFLTKSIAALLFTPALLISIFYFKKTIVLFKNHWFYIGFILFVLISTGYLFLRNITNPGYINILINNDIGRYNTVLDSHEEHFDFYFNRFYEERFKWLILVLPGVLLMWLNSKLRPAFVFLLLLFTCYLIILSSSVSKVEWYDLPFYPILSIFCGYTLYIFIFKFNSNQTPFLNALMLCSIFIIPLYFTFRNSYKNEIKPGDKKLEILNEYAYRNKNNQSLDKVTFLTMYFDRSLYFYKYKLNARGLNFNVTNCLDSLKENSIIIVAEDSLKNAVLKKYKTSIIDEYKSVLKLKI